MTPRGKKIKRGAYSGTGKERRPSNGAILSKVPGKLALFQSQGEALEECGPHLGMPGSGELRRLYPHKLSQRPRAVPSL